MVVKAAGFGVEFGMLAGLIAAWWEQGTGTNWPSRNPIAFGAVAALVCFVVGLLIITSSAASRRPV